MDHKYKYLKHAINRLSGNLNKRKYQKNKSNCKAIHTFVSERFLMEEK